MDSIFNDFESGHFISVFIRSDVILVAHVSSYPIWLDCFFALQIYIRVAKFQARADVVARFEGERCQLRTFADYSALDLD
jgi:hypothetical protein